MEQKDLEECEASEDDGFDENSVNSSDDEFMSDGSAEDDCSMIDSTDSEDDTDDELNNSNDSLMNSILRQKNEDVALPELSSINLSSKYIFCLLVEILSKL